jgi:uncharacterized protein (DUF2236 family)
MFHAGVFDALRSTVAGSIRGLVGTRGERHLPIATPNADPDPGLFGPGSVTWQIHADGSMLIGGVRALLVQTLNPATMAGVASHSNYRDDPLGRLARTGTFVAATTFGTTAEADTAIAGVARIHARVRGTSAEGIDYDATDPRQLAWVHNVEVDSFLRAYERYGSDRIDAADADRYVAEMAVLARRMGAAAADVPETVDALRTWLREVPEQRATGATRDAVRFLAFPPLPIATRGAYALILAAAIGLIPLDQRRKLWLPFVPFADPLVVRPATRLLFGVLGWALRPSPVLTAARARVG